MMNAANRTRMNNKVWLFTPSLWLLGLLLTHIVSAQSALVLKGDSLVGAGNYSEALKQYKNYLKDSPDSSVVYKVGTTHMANGDCKRAVKYFKEAKEAGFSALRVDFNMAKCFATNGEKEKAISLLEGAVENGLPVFRRLEQDIEFSSLQSDPRFVSIISKAKSNAYPCEGNPIMRKFDFWIGEWDVYVGNTKVGENSITKISGGCALLEFYTTPGTFTGHSINYYDAQINKWRQNWVGSSPNNVRKFVETKSDTGMIQFLDESTNAQGVKVLTRMTFSHNTDKNTVRQHIETSSDEGDNWTTGFDGLYVPKGT